MLNPSFNKHTSCCWQRTWSGWVTCALLDFLHVIIIKKGHEEEEDEEETWLASTKSRKSFLKSCVRLDFSYKVTFSDAIYTRIVLLNTISSISDK